MLLNRFLRYVAIDTQSAESQSFPSTEGQLTLLKMLANEMQEMGLTEVTQDAHGYVFGTIPATKGYENEPTIGFLAHVDTSPDVSGANVHPQLVRLLEGSGDTIIASDGTTLLGADDKAGIAIIMTAAERLLKTDAPPHGRIRVGFTPDEEVGRGTDFFDIEAFGASFAYTVDGGAEGGLEWENFNAASARVVFQGHNIHPGEAYGSMVNAARMAASFDVMLGDGERPENTRGREGFYHLVDMKGSVEHAELHYLLRDFSREGLEARKQRLRELAPEGAVVMVEDTYYNMSSQIPADVVERARRAMRRIGIEPVERPIRGGTDGARLSFMGLPCPNIFTGGANFHSRSEYCSLSAMQHAVEVVVGIAEVL